MFHTLITQPLFNLLVIFYKYVSFGDLGIAIIALTLAIRFILYPIFYKGLKSQMLMQQMQPEMQRIQKEYKDDKAKQAEMMMAMYKQYGTNPFSSIFFNFIQLPILFAVYRIFLTGITAASLVDLYSFITPPATINPMFLGLIDITKPNMVIFAITILVSALQSYLMVKQSAARGGKQNASTKYMAYLGPVLLAVILPKLPAAIGLYLTTTAIFSIFQQMSITKQTAAAKNAT
jgi:YidC/Oxa1 family membrane protein insertase